MMASKLYTGAFALIAVSLSLAACGDKDDTADDTDGPVSCDNGVDEMVPDVDATDAYWRADIEFHLDDPDESGPSITLTQGGTEVPGTSTTDEDMEVVYFTPDEPLLPSTEYVATLSYCVGDASNTFTTSELGGELTADILDKTYVIDLGSARFVEPAGVGELIGEFVTMNVLVGVAAIDGADITMMGALSEEGNTDQDFCSPTFDLSADFSESPYFVIAADSIELSVAGYTIPLQDFEVSGTFASDGSYFGGGVLAGSVDARDIVEMIDEVDTWEDACNLTASFGAACIACSDGVEACLSLRADQIIADENPGQVLEVVTEEGHPNCEE
jgi:hypothetical protein